MWRSYHSYPHSSCLKSDVMEKANTHGNVCLSIQHFATVYVCRRGIILYLECLFLRPNWFTPLFPPSWNQGGGNTRLRTRGWESQFGRIERKPTLCLLCGVCCAIFWLAPVGQKGRHLLNCVKCILAEHWPGKGAAKDQSLHYTCWSLARRRVSS